MQFSTYQTKIFNATEQTNDSLVIEALAGSGKTTTIVEAANYIDPGLRSLFVAFNKSIATELSTRLPSNIPAKTLHSVGLKNIMFHDRSIVMNDQKCRNIFRSMNGNRDYESNVLRLVSLGKGSISKNPDFEYYINEYQIVIEQDEIEETVALAQMVFAESLRQDGIIDYDDMIYWPAIGKTRMLQSDVLFVDERQDLNVAQIEMLRRLVAPGGRIIAVGDRHQSIYAFRGANVDAMDRMTAEFNACVLPLSICYRCGKSIVELAQKYVPEIEYSPNAIDGTLLSIGETKFFDVTKPGDMVLCRVNAPLVQTALHFIAAGVPAQVKGRDIGRSLNALVQKVQRRYICDSLHRFLGALKEYCEVEVSKLIVAEKLGPATALQDQFETIVAIAASCQTIEDISLRINQLFSDDVQGIICSTVHKAKGTEADNVMLLRPDLIPHPMAKTKEQKLQEQNVKYVAITRAKKQLAFIDGPIS